MQLKEICQKLAEIESKNTLTWHWPLLRHIVWVSLTDHGRILSRPHNPLRNTLKRFKAKLTQKPVPPLEGDFLFVSRPGYLQKTSNEAIDRIVDPIISTLNGNSTKAYIGSTQNQNLLYPAIELRPSFSSARLEITSDLQKLLKSTSEVTGIAKQELINELKTALDTYNTWYEYGLKLFKNAPTKKLLVACWYFPDMMGLIAAAKEYGIKSIDIQHGKQGQYQGMYSWWTKIPDEGFKMLPSQFWCWGQPSCEHIMNSSPDRKTHKAFVGGFPWLDYYKKNLKSSESSYSTAEKRILFSLQPANGAHKEPIPSYILEFLSSEAAKNVHIRFRSHPNYKDGVHYCKERLKDIPQERYSISDGSNNLYDDLIGSTHHITAFSSVCYEAQAFGVPTQLFGEDAKSIYENEIQQNSFQWNSGARNELESWINQPIEVRNDNYIESSLEKVSVRLQELLVGQL